MYCIRYSQLDRKFQNVIKGIYKDVTFQDEYILYDYDKTGNGYSIHGYLSIEHKSITQSRFYGTLQSATKAYYPLDYRIGLEHFNCYCVTKWNVDASLSKSQLESVFLNVALLCANEKEYTILWMEHEGHLLFYPIKPLSEQDSDYIPLVTHFVTNVYKAPKKTDTA